MLLVDSLKETHKGSLFRVWGFSDGKWLMTTYLPYELADLKEKAQEEKMEDVAGVVALATFH